MIKFSPVKYDAFALQGGYDLSTPSLLLRPGAFRSGQNFEVAVTGGVSRIGGYERFDGRPSPSAATYTIVQVVSFTNTPTTGQTITQATSGATGYIVSVGANFMVVTKVTGTFNATSSITTPGPITIGTATTTTVAPTAQQQAQYTNLAADVYRADIGQVPGSGAVTGIVSVVFSNTNYVYAFRPNAGNTAVDLYKATSSGWTQVPFYKEISFTAGTGAGSSAPSVGTVLTQGSVTATVKRVCTQSGAWTGTAAGRLIITTPSGGSGNFTSGAATVSGGSTLTLSGVQTAITLAVGGTFEFTQGNFYGQFSSLRLYGCDGVNRAFEFDGDVLAPITTGASTDTPKHIVVHKNFLILSIESSIFYSAVGDPFRWTTADGAGEIATGDTITNMVSAPGDQTTATLVVAGRSNTFVLYGTSAATWNLVAFNTNVGCMDYTMQNMADTYLFDNRGVFMLQATRNFGNFESAALTRNISSFIEEKRTLVSYATIARQKSQYRVFFNDGSALYITVVNGKFLGSAPMLFPDIVRCVHSNEQADGTEVAYFGSESSNGYVYQLDKGSSFDGANLDAYVTLAYNFANSPRLLKQWRHASLEMQGTSYANIDFGYAFSYGSTEIDQPAAVAYSSGFQISNWDSFTWDAFTWDGVTLSPTEVDVVGTAENVQATISSTTDYILPYTVNSLTYHYTPRRGLR